MVILLIVIKDNALKELILFSNSNIMNNINEVKTDSEQLEGKNQDLNVADMAQKSYDTLEKDSDYSVEELVNRFMGDYEKKFPQISWELGKFEFDYLKQIKDVIESFEDTIDTSVIAFKLQHEREKILQEYPPKNQEKMNRMLNFIVEFTFWTLVPYERKKRNQPLF